MTGLSDFFKIIQEEKKNQDKELYSLLGEEFSTDSFIDSLFSSAKEEIKKEKVIEEKITKIFDDIISNKNEAVVEEIDEEGQEEEIEKEEIVQESSQDESINQYIDFLKETDVIVLSVKEITGGSGDGKIVASLDYIENL